MTSCGTNACWNISLEDKTLQHRLLASELIQSWDGRSSKRTGGGSVIQERQTFSEDGGHVDESSIEGLMLKEQRERAKEDMKRSVVDYRFNTQTMIEDTASSHEAILQGKKGIYHFQRLVLGARKGAADYMAALFRWSQGGVQVGGGVGGWVNGGVSE